MVDADRVERCATSANHTARSAVSIGDQAQLVITAILLIDTALPLRTAREQTSGAVGLRTVAHSAQVDDALARGVFVWVTAQRRAKSVDALKAWCTAHVLGVAATIHSDEPSGSAHGSARGGHIAAFTRAAAAARDRVASDKLLSTRC